MRSSQTARSKEEGYVLHLGLRWTPHLSDAIASQSTRCGVQMDSSGGHRDLTYHPSDAASRGLTRTSQEIATDIRQEWEVSFRKLLSTVFSMVPKLNCLSVRIAEVEADDLPRSVRLIDRLFPHGQSNPRSTKVRRRSGTHSGLVKRPDASRRRNRLR